MVQPAPQLRNPVPMHAVNTFAVQRQLACITSVGMTAVANSQQPLQPLAASFTRVRESGRRLGEFTRAAGDAPLLLLVELDAEFFSHLQGRYRWQARARLTAGKAGAEAATDALNFPVYVNFDHEQAPAVLATAAPTVADRAGALLDQVLSAGP